MDTVGQVMTALKKKGSEQTRKTYARHGAPDNIFGVKVADLKVIAKQIKGNQQLACELYETGNGDAMYLAGLVADGAQMTRGQLNKWARAADWKMLTDFTVPWVASEHPDAAVLAGKWIADKRDSVASTGWSTYSSIVAVLPDDELDLGEIKTLLHQVATSIHAAPNQVRGAMNGFVISVGACVKPLLKQAKSVARKMGEVTVDVGDTACKVPPALVYIEKVEKLGRVGTKRKTAKC